MKKLKVLHAITRLDKGGSTENTLLSAIGLSEKGYEVEILYGITKDPVRGLIQRAEEAGVKFWYEPFLVRNIHPVKDLLALIKIFFFIKRNKYDIVHAHSHKAGLVCRMAARLAGRSRIVYTPHGHVFYGYFSDRLTKMIINAEKFAAGFTDVIVGLTPSECGDWLRFGVGQRRQYASVPSGIDFALMEQEAKGGPDKKRAWGFPPGSTVVGGVGRFVEIKGFEYFIDAAQDQVKKRDDICFVLVGEGPLKNKFETLIKDKGLEGRFIVCPWEDRTAPVINAFDIFVMPSLNEGMGRVLIQAMYLGKPVIASGVGGVPSVIGHEAGLMVPPRSALDISRAIDVVLMDSEKRSILERKARETAIKGYSMEVMVEKLHELYHALYVNEFPGEGME